MIGRDDDATHYAVLYADGRGLSRVYAMTFAEGQWSMWRDNPQFSQRFEASVGSPADTITGEWQKRGPEDAWEHDFDVTYIRITPLI